MQRWFQNLDDRNAVQRAEGLERVLKICGGRGPLLQLNERPVISFASNDYLGLSAHPRVLAAAIKALDHYGAGATASPLICGNKPVHDELARALAEFKGAEAALLFASGYQAALATLTALAEPETTILIDRLSHASLIDGAKLSGARLRTFHHNDVADLARLLEKEQSRRCIVVIESLYSMDGDLAPVAEMTSVSARFDALLLVDEAHATGVLGQGGRGLLASGAPLPEHAIALGTLSKSLGAQGGFICASTRIIKAIMTGRAHMFSTALVPASAAAALEALRLIEIEPHRRAQLSTLSAYVRGELSRMGFLAPSMEGPIIPVMLGAEKTALIFSECLLARGFFVPVVRYPTVKKGQARLRISLSAAHSKMDCDGLLSALGTLQGKNDRD